MLVVHGIFHNCVGGLLSVRDLFTDLESLLRRDSVISARACQSMPTPEHQADALVALLHALHIDQIDVIGESAGATSALQLALRHPERVKHLAVLVGNLPGSPTAVVHPTGDMKHSGKTPPFRTPRGEAVPGSTSSSYTCAHASK